MKLATVALLVVGLSCNSMLAMAEDPVPFRALMQTAGAQPSIPPIRDSKDQSAPVSTEPAPRRHMTTGGKIMVGVGIGMMVIGGVAMLGAAGSIWATSTEKNSLYGAGGGAMAGGAILIVLGAHRRSVR
jgi:hypothetical protein